MDSAALSLKRGDVVLVVASGDHGKPRPAVVVQSDLFNDTHASMTVCPVTSSLVEAPLFRVPLKRSKANGLALNSQIMVGKRGQTPSLDPVLTGDDHSPGQLQRRGLSPIPRFPDSPPRLLPVSCLALMPYAQDSDDVVRRIEKIEGDISGGSARDDEFTNVVVRSSSDERMCFENVDCAADTLQRLRRGFGR